MSEKTKKNEVVTTVSEADAMELMNELGTPFESEDQIKDSYFISKFPAVKKYIEKVPNVEHVSQLMQFMDAAYYAMDGEGSYTPSKIILEKRVANHNDPSLRRGMIKVGDSGAPCNSVNIIPLVLHKCRVYWKEYNEARPEFVCKSANALKGVWKNDDSSLVVKDCGPCPYKEWGCTKEGVVIQGESSKPPCTTQYSLLCATEDLNQIYEVIIRGYCLTKKLRVIPNIIDGGKMQKNLSLPLDLPKALLSQILINHAEITPSSTWLTMSGAPNAKNTSAVTRISNSGKKITTEEFMYLGLLKKWALDYTLYGQEGFVNFMKRADGPMAVDVDEAHVAETQEEYTDVLDSDD